VHNIPKITRLPWLIMHFSKIKSVDSVFYILFYFINNIKLPLNIQTIGAQFVI